MPRYAAFLRGVMPFNCKMPALKAAFEAAGFTNVKTVLGSGNVAFDARSSSEQALEQKAEAAMHEQLGRTFFTIVRPIEQLQALLATNPISPSRSVPRRSASSRSCAGGPKRSSSSPSTWMARGFLR